MDFPALKNAVEFRLGATVYQSIWKLLSENPGISYIKWDCNRYITNPGSSFLGKDRQSNLFIDYPTALL